MKRDTMTRQFLTTATAALICGALPALADGPLIVTSTADDGAGSLRAALASASAAQGPQQILLAVGEGIELETGLVYSGAAPLTLIGTGQTISIAVDETLLTASAGADLSVEDLTFRGPGGFDLGARADIEDGTAGKGIFVDLRDDQSGLATLSLTRVTVADVASHGIHVSDVIVTFLRL